MTGVLIRRERCHTKMKARGEHHVTTEQRPEWLGRQRGTPRPDAPQKPGRRKEGLHLEVQREHNPADVWTGIL